MLPVSLTPGSAAGSIRSVAEWFLDGVLDFVVLA